MSEPLTLADERHRAQMRQLLVDAADCLGVTTSGMPVFGWRDHSIGARAHRAKDQVWIRVVTEQHRWAHGDFWTGNADSGVIRGVPKPEVIDSVEWDDGPELTVPLHRLADSLLNR